MQLPCRERNWCGTVHDAVLTLLLKKKPCKAEPGARHHCSAGMEGWLSLEMHPGLAWTSERTGGSDMNLESYWFVREGRIFLGCHIVPPQYYSFACFPMETSHWWGLSWQTYWPLFFSFFSKICLWVYLGLLEDMFLLQETQSDLEGFALHVTGVIAPCPCYHLFRGIHPLLTQAFLYQPAMSSFRLSWESLPWREKGFVREQRQGTVFSSE